MKLPFKSTLILIFLLANITACVYADPKTGQDVAQIIVKFKDASTEPATTSLLKSLTDTTMLKVRHVRPMAGGAQIYVLSGVADDAALTRAMKLLSARPDVEYAEVDRKLKPQKDSSNEGRK